MSPTEIIIQLGLWIVNWLVNLASFVSHFILYLHVWIRIRNTNPDQGSSGIRIQYGSGSTTLFSISLYVTPCSVSPPNAFIVLSTVICYPFVYIINFDWCSLLAIYCTRSLCSVLPVGTLLHHLCWHSILSRCGTPSQGCGSELIFPPGSGSKRGKLNNNSRKNAWKNCK